tara:strand:- start:828 stop:1019 length:192 start_codon:yes stop_codon:yes gene_type:complete
MQVELSKNQLTTILDALMVYEKSEPSLFYALQSRLYTYDHLESGVEIENVTDDWYDEDGNLIP